MGRPRNNYRKYKRKILEKIILDTNILIEILKNNKASSLIFAYAKSHNLNIPDGLIAATSLKSNIPLYTLNTKDFYYIDGINLID